MTKPEAVNWLINLSADIGKAEHQSLWHYEQALSEIKELLESEHQEEPQEGEWKEISTGEAKDITLQYMRCSACKRWHIVLYYYRITPSEYCPHCGAKMKKG